MYQASSGRFCKNAIWCLMVFMIFSFTSLSTYTWGRYIYLLACAGITILYAVENNGKICKELDVYQRKYIYFAAYTGMSSVWALQSNDSITQMTTLVTFVVFFYPIYMYYRDIGTLDNLISAIKWGAVAIAIYTISYFGLDNLMRSAQASNLRIENEFANANTLGVVCALAIVLQVWQTMYDRCKKWEIISAIPVFLVAVCSQSKKAVILAVLGVVLLVVIKNMENKLILNGLLKTVVALLLVYCAFRYLSTLDIADGVIQRFTKMFESLNSGENSSGSTSLREQMISVGLSSWLRAPILGVGVGCTHVIASQYIGINTYLHNNYVELLCGGGIIAFLLYYSMHFYCIKNLYRLRFVNKAYFSLLFTIILLLLVADYGMVSYYSKVQGIYLLAVFIGVKKMQQQYTDSEEYSYLE